MCGFVLGLLPGPMGEKKPMRTRQVHANSSVLSNSFECVDKGPTHQKKGGATEKRMERTTVLALD